MREGGLQAARDFLDESLTLFRELGNKFGIAWALNYLGDAAFQSGEKELARALFIESLVLFRELENPDGIAENLRDFAILCAAQSENDRAARLWGAEEALRETLGSPLKAAEQERYARQMNPARTAMGVTTFDAACANGQAMDWKQATAYALGED